MTAKKKKTGFEEVAKESAFYHPQEQLVKTKTKKGSLLIGVPKETEMAESRVSLTPRAVEVLVNNGHEVMVETGAGKAAKFLDNDYSEAGAKIVYSSKEAFEGNIILKIEPPTAREISYIKPGTTLISALQLGRLQPETIKQLAEKKITGIAYEFLQDEVGGIPLVRAMGEIAGSTVMLIAAEYMSSTNDGMGVILGGITGVPPAKVVVIGAGTVAQNAVRAALGLGAEVKVFDNHLYKLRRLRHDLGFELYTSVIDQRTLQEALVDADVVVGALRGEEDEQCPCVVSEEMVSKMKPGSIIVDVSIDQGGCVETSEVTTHKNPVFTKNGVIHYCVPNIPARVARTASKALSHILRPVLMDIADAGGVEEMIYQKQWFANGIYTYRGNVTNAYISKRFGFDNRDLNLLLAPRL